MPAMPQEKTPAISLNENNFSELKYKGLNTSVSIVSTMATTATVKTNSRLHQSQQQSSTTHTPEHRNMCGCGAESSSYTDVVDSFQRVNNNNNNTSDNKYMLNGHSSPLAAAMCAENIAPGNLGSTEVRPSTSSSTTTKGIQAATTPPKKSANDFKFGKIIGDGSFSSVYEAVDIHNHRKYAIKVCEKRHIQREKKEEYVLREREALHRMSNVPGFVNLSCTFQLPRSLFFVMTYAKNGDLLPYINKVGSFDTECTRHYAAELVLACEQMHRRNIIHRDLKPENILLDESMHTLIGDFGSAKILTAEQRAETIEILKKMANAPNAINNLLCSQNRKSRSRSRTRSFHLAEGEDSNDDKIDQDDEDKGTGSDDVESPHRIQPRHERRRKGSFVGTAQYVSPEVLQNGPITPAADLWALGCIIYQMISGLPPFRASNEFFIFRAITACNYEFPEGFDKDAADLVNQLLRINPAERLGILDNHPSGQYTSIRNHSFFNSIDFSKVRSKTPPPILPYLPGVSKDEDTSINYSNLEPGLDNKQLTRLMGLDLGTKIDVEVVDNGECIDEVDSPLVLQHSSSPSTSCSTSPQDRKMISKTISNTGHRKSDEIFYFNLSPVEKQIRLEQQKSDKWHVFADNELILKKGFINKRKGLFARRRMLLLTTGPRLIYIDPVQMIKKGEIPWSSELRVEGRNFKIFLVHTPNRTYYLEDTEDKSNKWVDAIKEMHTFTYKNPTHRKTSAHQQSSSNISVVTTRTSSSN